MSMKNPMTLAGTETATFRFVAQHHLFLWCDEKRCLWTSGLRYVLCLCTLL